MGTVAHTGKYETNINSNYGDGWGSYGDDTANVLQDHLRKILIDLENLLLSSDLGGRTDEILERINNTHTELALRGIDVRARDDYAVEIIDHAEDECEGKRLIRMRRHEVHRHTSSGRLCHFMPDDEVLVDPTTWTIVKPFMAAKIFMEDLLKQYQPWVIPKTPPWVPNPWAPDTGAAPQKTYYTDDRYITTHKPQTYWGTTVIS
jgi:hypothetical protein